MSSFCLTTDSIIICITCAHMLLAFLASLTLFQRDETSIILLWLPPGDFIGQRRGFAREELAL